MIYTNSFVIKIGPSSRKIINFSQRIWRNVILKISTQCNTRGPHPHTILEANGPINWFYYTRNTKQFNVNVKITNALFTFTVKGKSCSFTKLYFLCISSGNIYFIAVIQVIHFLMLNCICNFRKKRVSCLSFRYFGTVACTMFTGRLSVG